MTTDLFDPSEWSGEFFFPDSRDSRFHGDLLYSPETGIVLTYLMLDCEVFRKSDVLHGILNTGDPCTLFGKLPFPVNTTMKNRFTSRNGKAGFPLMAIGGFLSADETVTEINFSLTNLQEFFYPSGFKDFVKYSSAALYSVSVPFGTIEVGNSAQFTMLPKEIEAVIHSQEPEALNKLSKAFGSVCADHPDAFFYLKKDIEYRIVAKFDSPQSVEGACQQILNISNLFSVLLFSPVYPESIQFHKLIDDVTVKIDLYPAMLVDPRTTELCKRTRSHYHMPITQGTISLDTVVDRWFREPKRYSVIVSALQGETGFRDEHSALGDILLYATQLESISFSEGQKKKDRKYIYPLETYASARIQRCLTSAFGVSDLEKVGEAISDLRSEIAHVGRPRKWLATLTLAILVKIAHCLQLTVIDHALKQLGVPDETRRKYQEVFCPGG